jgi:ubiquinone biosynthesis protein
LWRPEDPSLFHADPHAGNLFRRSDGALVILDWSLVGRLGKCEREQMVQMLLGALRLDRAAIARAIRALAISDVRETPLLDIVDKAAADLAAGRPPGFRWLLDLLDEVAIRAGARFDQSLVFYRKSILTLEGVLADIVPDDRLGQVMSMTGAVQVLGESPFRGWAPPESRAFGSHLSNLDLLRLCWALPEASLRLWSRWLDAGPSGAP